MTGPARFRVEGTRSKQWVVDAATGERLSGEELQERGATRDEMDELTRAAQQIARPNPYRP